MFPEFGEPGVVGEGVFDGVGAVVVEGVGLYWPLEFVCFYCAAGGAAAKGVGVVLFLDCVLDDGPVEGVGGVEVVVLGVGGEVGVFAEAVVAEP